MIEEGLEIFEQTLGVRRVHATKNIDNTNVSILFFALFATLSNLQRDLTEIYH